MKKSELLAASVLAASATAVGTTTTTTTTFTATAKPPHQEVKSSKEREDSAKEKFAPRFDGLRFIETLVTAHR
ncbi:hypothetical protein V2J09_019200 [Rumex salicifolius]